MVTRAFRFTYDRNKNMETFPRPPPLPWRCVEPQKRTCSAGKEPRRRLPWGEEKAHKHGKWEGRE